MPEISRKCKKCFPSLYTCFSIEDSMDHNLPLSKVESFLNIFRHLIKSIRWRPNRRDPYENGIFNAIVAFCGKSLQYLIFILIYFQHQFFLTKVLNFTVALLMILKPRQTWKNYIYSGMCNEWQALDGRIISGFS